MDFLEKIDKLMAEKGVNRAELARQSGIPYNTIRNFYELGYDNMKLSTLQKLADYFDVSMDFLVREIDPPAFPLSPREKELVEYFRSLNDTGQTILLKNAAAYSADPDLQQAPPILQTGA